VRRKNKPTASEVARWRERSFEVQTSDVVAGRARGPEPPKPWAPRMRSFVRLTHRAREMPSWWTPVSAYFGNVETRRDPASYYWDGMQRVSRRDLPLVFFQFTFAGFGNFEVYGQPPQRITPGTGFFAVVPSRHRYYLPESSPGWTFAWVGIYHPYLVRRIAKQVERTGPFIQATPGSPLVTRLARLVRGAFLKDFRDPYEVEAELLAFTHAYERSVRDKPRAQKDDLLQEVEQRVLSNLGARVDVTALASERGLSRTRFTHHFRERTGLSPARFMTEVRLRAAEHLLLSTPLPLSRIARDCGFANANHFGKVFQRFRQQTPSAFRRALRRFDLEDGHS
jgi:AraC-like DNA-binding protein